jgi:hypothetical protein
VYTVEADSSVQQEIDALPAEALASFAEVRVVLETAPWSGRALRKVNPQGEVRTHAFGRTGIVVYVILERQRRVELVRIVWAG